MVIMLRKFIYTKDSCRFDIDPHTVLDPQTLENLDLKSPRISLINQFQCVMTNTTNVYADFESRNLQLIIEKNLTKFILHRQTLAILDLSDPRGSGDFISTNSFKKQPQRVMTHLIEKISIY